MVKHSENSKEISIGFYGGEPLLEVPLIREVVDYAEAVSYTHLDVYKRQDYSYEIQKKAAQQNQNVDTGKSALNITDKANNSAYALT